MPYLAACLESIESQSYEQWELIAVDNQSSDGSYELLLDRAKGDSRIKVLRNQGETEIHVSIPLGLKACTGEYVTRMDADDLMSPQKLELLVSGLKGGKSIAVGEVEYFSDEGIGEGFLQYATWLNENIVADDPFVMIYKECVIASPAWLMRRADLVKDKLLDSLCVPDDYMFSFNLFKNGYKVSPVKNVVHCWRDYACRNSRQDERYSQKAFLDFKVAQYVDLLPAKSEVVLWGAGPKGKHIAKELIRKDVVFKWVTENPNKIGKGVYGVVLKDPSQIKKGDEVVVAVSNKDEQASVFFEIKKAQAKPVPFC